MTMFEPQPTNTSQGDDDEILDRLRRWVARADTTADELATRGGQERETAAQHMRAAERYDEQAVAAREKADELRALVAFAEQRRAARDAANHGPRDAS
ncbi:hypothetical protein AB0L05_27905 [Nonomuraea pusilla]|uniref:hypothetical protein n=1 Tax=Nonomuraea pusilla TaxID=46177 RepID=UPI0033308EBA